jgi:hypothetical protein
MIANILSHKIEKPSPEEKYPIIQKNQIPLQTSLYICGCVCLCDISHIFMWDSYVTNYLGFGLNWMVMSLMAKVKLFICISRIWIRAFFSILWYRIFLVKFSNKIAKLVKFTLEKKTFPKTFPNLFVKWKKCTESVFFSLEDCVSGIAPHKSSSIV